MGEKQFQSGRILQVPSQEPDRLPVFPNGIPESDTCQDCRGRIVNDQTPARLLRNSTICRCFQDDE